MTATAAGSPRLRTDDALLRLALRLDAVLTAAFGLVVAVLAARCPR